MSRLKTILTESTRILLPLVILAVGLGGFMVFGQKPESPKKKEVKKTGTAVKAIAVKEFTDTFPLDVEGQVVPYQSIKLSAEVSGRVVNLPKETKSGFAVNAGQKLLSIDASDYNLELRRTTAEWNLAKQKRAELEVQIANATSSLAVGKKELALQQVELKRSEDLFRDDAIVETELDRSKIQVLNSETAVQNLKNQLALLEAQRKTLEIQEDLAKVQADKAQLNIDRTTISSPVSGSITSVQVEENDFVPMGTVAVTLISSEKMEAQCSLRLDELAWILQQAGPDAMKSMQAGAGFELPPTKVNVIYDFQGRTYSWEGKLSRFEGTGMDAKTRTVPCRVRVDEPTKITLLNDSTYNRLAVGPPSLFSGMYVTIRAAIQPKRKLLEIPLDALRPGNIVWVAENGKLKIHDVSVARTEKRRVLLFADASELRAGDRVIVSPIPLVTEGMTIQEQPES